ncbi:DNA (cytosine-5-)-methyltransferase, partial [Kitasatospora sp. NPDC091276]|uniref:DNA cytosine methyltransferase n=1 Tax=Kitasatospora sp. NPDC091276 TaxID=3155300 RepID=UPI00343B09CD
MPILELCAGVGALGVVAEHITSDQVRYVADIDPGACAVLAERYPDAPNLGDIKQIDWASLVGEVDIITSGFPCQGISNAGLRKGLEDERSGLWYTVLEAIRVLRPRIVFLENVSAILRRGLPEVVAGLAEIGYDARWSCIRASDIGAAHHRDRWFCVAVPQDADGESWDQWRRAAPRQKAGPCSSHFCGGTSDRGEFGAAAGVGRVGQRQGGGRPGGELGG